jgi:hypothetical protein
MLDKFGYKKGVYYFNKNNIGSIPNFGEAEEFFLSQLNRIKNESTDYEKCISLEICLFCGGFGEAITKEHFIKILEYIDLDWEVFEKFILDTRRKKINGNIMTGLWFDTLNMETFQESSDYVKRRMDELSKESKGDKQNA